jgi:hypothetical protein
MAVTMPKKCKCGSGKRKYATEEDAKYAAAWMTPRFGQPVRVYKCVGSNKWHLATRNPGLSTLSQARKIALQLVRRKRISRSEISDMLVCPKPKRLRTLLKNMEDLGVLVRDGDILIARDTDGLNRIILVGLRMYTQERNAQ